MYSRPNLNNNERNTCARSNVYNASCILSLNGKKVKKVDKIKFLGVIMGGRQFNPPTIDPPTIDPPTIDPRQLTP